MTSTIPGPETKILYIWQMSNENTSFLHTLSKQAITKAQSLSLRSSQYLSLCEQSM